VSVSDGADAGWAAGAVDVDDGWAEPSARKVAMCASTLARFGAVGMSDKNC